MVSVVRKEDKAPAGAPAPAATAPEAEPAVRSSGAAGPSGFVSKPAVKSYVQQRAAEGVDVYKRAQVRTPPLLSSYPRPVWDGGTHENACLPLSRA